MVLRCAAIQAPHLFTTRALNVRQDRESWEKLAAALGVEAAGIFRPRQVHGAAAIVVPAPEIARGHDASACAADIIMTNDARAAVAVQAADCVPLLLCDPVSGAVAAAHAGWRGTAAGVAGLAIFAMTERFGSRAADLIAAVGPSIGPCCYQVGEELLAPFGPAGRRWFYHLGGSWMLNLWNANRDQLIEAGVKSANVHISELCTAMHPDVFDSYRRDGGNAGRMVAAIRPQ
jgi:YfiH family protein